MKENHLDYDTYGFKRSELEDILNIDFSTLTISPTPSDDISNTDGKSNHHSEKTNSDEKKEIDRLNSLILSLRTEIQSLRKITPIELGTHLEGEEKDPLFQAIQIRNSEWANYDPSKDRTTRANQTSIVTDLRSKGFSEATAKAIETVACPINRNPSKA